MDTALREEGAEFVRQHSMTFSWTWWLTAVILALGGEEAEGITNLRLAWVI